MIHNFGSITTTLDDEGLLTQISYNLTGVDDTLQASTEVVIDTDPMPVPEGDELEAFCKAHVMHERAQHILYQQIQRKRSAPRPVSLEDKKVMWMAQIDTNVANVYTQFTRFQMEYEQREKAALAYRAAGYTGDPTVWLIPFADTNGITYQECADIVIAQAEKLRSAIVALGELRMNKYKVKNAANEEIAMEAFVNICNQVNTLARSL